MTIRGARANAAAPPAAWWLQLPVDPLAAIREVAAALRDRRLPTAEAGQHVAAGLAKYLNGEEQNLARALGLRVRRGGRYEVPSRKARYDRRNELVRQALTALGSGPRRARAEKLSAALAASAPVVDGEQLGEVLEALQIECAAGLSCRQILRIAAAGDDDV